MQIIYNLGNMFEDEYEHNTVITNMRKNEI